MSDEFEEFTGSVLVWDLDLAIWSSNWHIQDLHVKLRDLMNQGLEVFKLNWTHQNTDAILVRLEIVLATLVIYFSVYDAVKRY